MTTQPTNVRQLTDRTAERMLQSSFTSVLRTSERNAFTPAAVTEAGVNAKNTQVVINLNTVEHLRAARLGGQTKNSTTNANVPPPAINIGIIGGKTEFDALLRELFYSGMLEGTRSLFEQHPQPIQPGTNVTFIGSVRA